MIRWMMYRGTCPDCGTEHIRPELSNWPRGWIWCSCGDRGRRGSEPRPGLVYLSPDPVLTAAVLS